MNNNFLNYNIALVRETWSFWEDAVHCVGDGDVDKGRAAIEPTVASIEEWLIAAFKKNELCSGLWLLALAVTGTLALIGALYGASPITWYMAFGVTVAGAAYAYQKSFYVRLVKRVRQGGPAPTAFTAKNGDSARNYISSVFATSQLMFDTHHEPTRFSSEPSVLDLVWLTGVKEAQPLKRALFGRDQFPALISRPERKVAPPPPKKEAPTTVTYKVSQTAYFDQRQLHVHAAAAKAEAPTSKATKPSKSKAKTKIAPHWLQPLEQAYFDGRHVSFEEHLPKAQKWMALVVHHGYPLVQKHQGWSDAKLLEQILIDISTLRATDDGKKAVAELPDIGTIKKMFNRTRSDPNYGWVRQYFTDFSQPHKYQDIDQDRLPLKNPG